MPPLPTLKHPVMNRVEQVVRAGSRAQVLACIERAEALALEVDPGLTYPEDWVLFRLTGDNGAAAPDPGLITGERLRAQLGPLVERVSAAIKLKLEEAGAGALDAPQLCARWKISRATLNRLRGRGLVSRRVQADALRAVLVFRCDVIERFERAHTAELERAAGFSRISEEEAARLVALAQRWRNERGLSLNQSAAQLAAETGRSHEGVRQLLRRAARGGAVTLREPPPISEERRRVLYRAWLRAVDLSLMARRTHRSRGAVRRAINMQRAERLRAVLSSGALVAPEGSGGRSKGADPLAQLPARTGLNGRSPSRVTAFIAAARTLGPPIGAEEKARLTAYQHLRGEAGRIIAKLDRLQPSASAVDRAETLLRWAARLKAELVRSQLRLMIDTLTARLGRPLEELAPAALVQTLEGALGVIGEVVDAHDVSKGGRLAAGVAMVLDRYAMVKARELAPAAGLPRRAVAVIPSSLTMPEWERRVCPWQDVVEPDRRLRAAIEAGWVTGPSAVLLAKRYGWDGGPPRTLPELAGELKLTRPRVLGAEQQALAAALKAVREHAQSTGV